jgi:hypothetical protein
MRKVLAIATATVVGGSAAAAGAAGTLQVPTKWFGSDTLQVITWDALGQANNGYQGGDPNIAGGGTGGDGHQAAQYLAGGSGAGQGAMANSTLANAIEQAAPMSKLMTSGICGTASASVLGVANGTSAQNAAGIVVAMDAVSVYSSVQSGGASACTTASSNTQTTDGLAFSGKSYFAGSNATQNWKWALALLYGGLDLSVPGSEPDCNSNARQNLVANWSNLFQNGCANPYPIAPGSTTNICAQAAGTGFAGALGHAFRRDDASGTSDVFSAIIGLQVLMPSPSASSNNGFGASPYCNAMNWDTNTSNATCALTPPDQFVGPGGVIDSASQCVFTDFASTSTAEVCLGQTGQPAATTLCSNGGNSAACASGQTCTSTTTSSGICMGTGATGTACTANTDCVNASSGGHAFVCYNPSGGTGTGLCVGNHRRPSPQPPSPGHGIMGAYGDDPINENFTNADVLPTSYQDNDPIRRKCLGNTAGLWGNSGEEVCNLDGKLGVVLAIPATDFLTQNASGSNQQYPTNACTNQFHTGSSNTAASAFNCAPSSSAFHAAQCPNGDAQTSGGCVVPQDGTNLTAQCLNNASGFYTQPNRKSLLTPAYDGRRHNLAFFSGFGQSSGVSWIKQTIQNGKATPPSVQLFGGMGRIHSIQSVFDSNWPSPPNTGCQFKDATDQISCLAQADPCSIGYAGDGGKSHVQRVNGNQAVGPFAGPYSVCAQFATNTAGSGNPPNNPCVGSGTNANQPPYTSNTSASLTCPEECLEQGTSGSFTLTSDSVRVDGTYPTATNVQALGLQQLEYQISRKLYYNSILGLSNLTPTTGDPSITSSTVSGELDIAAWEAVATNVAPILNSIGYFPLGTQSPNGTTASAPPFGTVGNAFCEDFNEAMLCKDAPAITSETGTSGNACVHYNGLTSASGTVPGDTNGSYITVPGTSTSTVCGNGVKDPFEECDDGTAGTGTATDGTLAANGALPGTTAGNGTSGSNCSNICRCAGITSYRSVGGGPWGCQ